MIYTVKLYKHLQISIRHKKQLLQDRVQETVQGFQRQLLQDRVQDLFYKLLKPRRV